MAFDTFLEFPTPSAGGATPTQIKVVGESTDQSHPNTIQLTEFTFGAENPTTIGSMSGGAGAGKVQFHVMQIKKNVDAASAGLFAVLASGAHLPDATIYVRKAGGAATDYLVYKFKMVFVTKLDWSGSNGDDIPSETVQLIFGALQVSYAAQQGPGQLGKPSVTAWSQVTNKPELNVPGS